MKRLKSGSLFLGLVGCILLSSCVLTREEGDQMASDIARLKNELAALQREQSDFEIRHERRVSALESVTYKKASIESAQSDQLKKEIEQLRGQLEEAQRSFESTAEKPTPKASSELDNVPSDKKAHFEWAKEAFADEDFGVALIRIDSFLEKYRADNQYGAGAYLLRGDAARMLAQNATNDAAKKDFNRKAVTAYQDLLTRFPKSPRIPEGLFKVGEALEAMGFKSDAKIFYEEITAKHSKSSFAKQASKKLRELSKTKKK